jgi:hypothetical protein
LSALFFVFSNKYAAKINIFPQTCKDLRGKSGLLFLIAEQEWFVVSVSDHVASRHMSMAK